MATGKAAVRNMPNLSCHQVQMTHLPLTLLTVNAGPPERSRTRSPARSTGVVWLCVTGSAGAVSARAVTAHEALSATPNVARTAITANFGKFNMIGTFGKFNMAGPPMFPLRHFRSALAADRG